MSGKAQQTNIERIEIMPSFPQPYLMRDWEKVALGYDSLVFDLQASGDYLPLIWKDNGGVNYPDHERFGLDSYVGINSYKSAEGINVLPAIIGASLVGVDKSDQDGHNWVLMCEEFFNNRPEEDIYLNTFQASSGGDWWYDTMPNIFFYQLNDLYPGVGDFERQFKAVADRWLEAVGYMGGSTTAWTLPNMDYRAWRLSTMTGLADGIKEPEAAGAIAWILYNAFLKTGAAKYRIGAEWAMEFLNSRSQNPSYELQLPYGVYIAARMNAELNTKYDIEKMLNWCFTTNGNVRNWGAVTGNWGGFDCDGLIGEAENAGYAFIMNGFEQAGALLPMIKYDERFARAIGKWVLNCANASRLFYAQYLPDKNQDNEDWAKEYDPNSVIAYEALREYKWHSGETPYATGDAMRNNWGSTNLALYGSSHVGIFGAIIDTTNIPGILKLDLNKTDYFNESFPTYLYYNPHEQVKNVLVTMPDGSFDLYESLSNEIIATGISDTVSVTIKADEAILLTFVPEGSSFKYEQRKILVDGVVIDYNSGRTVGNYPPRIKALNATKDKMGLQDTLRLFCSTEDFENDSLSFIWTLSAGSYQSVSDGVVDYIAPGFSGDVILTSKIIDNHGLSDNAQIVVTVLDNHTPVIEMITLSSAISQPGDTLLITCLATDEDKDELFYLWKNEQGDSIGSGQEFSWIAPPTPGYYLLTCEVTDAMGGKAISDVGIIVGNLVVDLQFSGGLNDNSGFLNSGVLAGAENVEDRFGQANSAFSFDGFDDFILIENSRSLNFEEEITVHFWLKVNQFYDDREMYPISHGNWENRWKISITNKKIRWTVKTTAAIKDLDLSSPIDSNRYYCITATYNGEVMSLYVNANLSNTVPHSGKILKTSYDLIIGQALPGNLNFGFNGIIDDLKIYNRALNNQEVRDLYDIGTGIGHKNTIPKNSVLYQNYPNPFNPSTTIKFNLQKPGNIALDVFDVTGKRVYSIYKGFKTSGLHSIKWIANQKASGIYFIRLSTKEESFVKKVVKLK